MKHNNNKVDIISLQNALTTVSAKATLLEKKNDTLQEENYYLREAMNKRQRHIDSLERAKFTIAQIIQEAPKSDKYYYHLPILKIQESPNGVRIVVGNYRRTKRSALY
jgi:poly(3-hydroxyalkanoate) synthetase